MKKDCKLIGTLPNLRDDKGIDEMMSSPLISEARFNSGVNSLMNEEDIISSLIGMELSSYRFKSIFH